MRVERLPGRCGWGWTIWLAGGSEAAIRDGYTEAAKRGMAAAEDAAARRLGRDTLVLKVRAVVRLSRRMDCSSRIGRSRAELTRLPAIP
jgi:hypothetical protein